MTKCKCPYANVCTELCAWGLKYNGKKSLKRPSRNVAGVEEKP
jgi:hypothetical protein